MKEGKKEKNRTRKNRVSVYLNDSELYKLNYLVSMSSEKEISTVIRELILTGKIINYDEKIKHILDIKSLIFEVNAIGKNINQIAKFVNTGQSILSSDIEYMKSEIENMKLKIMSLL